MIVWSIITGIVSIISFLIAINDRFQEWKKYLWYIGFTFVGISIGLLLSSVEKIAINIDTKQALYFLLFFGLVIVLGMIVYLLIKKGQDLLGYVVFLIFLTMGLPKLNDLVKSDNSINQQEIIFLAKHYENKKAYEKSIEFWELYKEKSKTTLNDSIKGIVDSKIDELRKKQLE